MTLSNPKSEIRNPKSSRTATLLHRAGLYRLLGHLYLKELSHEMINEMEKNGFLREMDDQGYKIKEGLLQYPDIKQTTESSDYQPETLNQAVLLELAKEYAALFIVPGKKVSPYGSVHRKDDGKGGRLWGDTTVLVKKFIEHHGLEFKGKAYHGIPDHVGIELEFFSKLLEKEAKLRDEGREEDAKHCLKVQSAFFKDHLNSWVPGFCEKVISSTKLDFYREIARMTADFLESEAEGYVPDG